MSNLKDVVGTNEQQPDLVRLLDNFKYELESMEKGIISISSRLSKITGVSSVLEKEQDKPVQSGFVNELSMMMEHIHYLNDRLNGCDIVLTELVG